jgi:AraC-like DNA-binding protein
MNAPHNPLPISSLYHDSELGRWTLWRRPPAPLLAPYVTELQGYVEAAGRTVVRDEYPSGLVHMIIVLDHGFWLGDSAARGGSRPLDATFVAGMHRIPSVVGSRGAAMCMQVDFTPLGARRFLRLDNVEQADQVVDLEALLPEFARELEGRLLEAASWERRFAWLEACLARRILGGADDDRRIVCAWQALYASGGTLPIGILAERLDISRKHLVSMFTRHVGVPPKTYARIIRFARALDLLQARGARGDVSLADVAATCGYADQSHFNRDFKVMAGATPSSLLQRLIPDGTGVVADG